MSQEVSKTVIHTAGVASSKLALPTRIRVNIKGLQCYVAGPFCYVPKGADSATDR
jgi:hypothetical protein